MNNSNRDVPLKVTGLIRIKFGVGARSTLMCRTHRRTNARLTMFSERISKSHIPVLGKNENDPMN